MPTDAEIQAIEQSDNAPEVARQLAQEYAQQEAASENKQEAASVDGFAGTWDADNIVESMFRDEVKSGILSKSEVAEFQGYYDDSGRTIDLNELEAMVRDYIKNKKEANINEGGKQSSDGSMGWKPDVGPGEQAGSIQKSAGRAEENKRAERSSEGSRREDIPKAHRVSSKEIGLSNGTDKQNLEVVPDKKLHPATQRIINAFEKTANGFTAVKGRLEVEQGIIQGVTTTDGKVIFRTDHAVYGQEEILLHECGHLYIRGDRALKNALKDACLESMTEKELYQLSIKYGSLWQELMSEDITDDEFLDSMLEEIYCDALAGIDRIKASGAGRLTEAVRAVFAEETGIDVDALLNGAELVTQTAAKTEKSKSTKGQPRNNGPPVESYSLDEYSTAQIKNWENSKRIIVYSSRSQLSEFIKKSLNDNLYTGKLYFGIVGEKLSTRIKNDTGYDFYGRNVTLRADNVRKTIKDHGSEKSEKPRGQRSITQEDFALIPNIIGEPDEIIKSTYNNRPAAEFVKRIDGSKITVIAVDSGGSLDLYVQTMYAGIKKGSIASMANAEALTKTPEATTGTAPNDSIFSEDENVNRYSVDDNLEYELYEVYNGTFDSRRNEVHIGTTSNFMTDVIGAEGLELFMPAEKAYRAMKTERQAIFEGKPYGGNINYHGLGVDGLMDILNASENPIAAFVDTPSSNNKRENRIVLVTDVNADGGLGVVIEEVDTKALSNDRIIKANKAITVYPKSNVSSAIQEAIADNRILYLDEKRSQVRLAGMKGANYPTAISEADFTNNIRRFWENVKWKKSGKAEFTAESTSEELPEWKKKLAQFGADDSEDVYFLVGEKRESIEEPTAELNAQTEAQKPAGTWDPDNIVESMFPEEVKNGILNKNEVAEFQGYYDDSGRTIDLNELEYVLRGYIKNKYKRLNKEANKNGGNNISDRIEGRDGNKSSGKQASELAEGAERNRISAPEQSRKAVSRQNSTAYLGIRKISSKELGFREGTDAKTIVVLPEDALNDELRVVKKTINEETGLPVMFVLGAITVKGLDGNLYAIRGVFTGEIIIIQADDLSATAQQIADHEIYHWKAKNNPGLNSDIKQAIIDDFGEKELRIIAEKYIQRHRGIIDIADDANGEKTMARILEEIFADAYAGLNSFGAGKFSETVNSIMASKNTGKRSQQNNGTKETRGPPMDRYSLETLPDGKKYVRADRQVIFGNDPETWSEQLEAYINSKIRKGENVHLIAEDGDVLTITEDTAGKVSSRYKDGRTMSDEAFERKVSAGTHIDELAQVSVRGKKTVADADNKHGAMASAGWNYRTAYFLDFDGKYYRCTISVSISKNGNAVYNIGEMKERSFPTAQKALSGSSANSGALGREASSQGSIRKSSEDVNSYSVDDNLEYELYEVYNGTFDASKNEVHIGTTSNFMTDVIGAEGLDLFMSAEKAYRAMKTEHQAIFEGKPYGGNINYHGLGVDGLLEILNASENPIAAYAAATGESGKRENRIVLVTDVNADGGLGVVIEEVDTKARVDGKRIKANKAITVYPKSNVSSAIQEAIADDRILYLDEKRSQILRSGGKGSNYPTAISEADFANNIRSFWENVKWKKAGSNEYTAESSSENGSSCTQYQSFGRTLISNCFQNQYSRSA